MPLSRTDYNPARGELFTHSDENPYVTRIRSQYLFRSKNNESLIATSDVTFTNAVTIGGSTVTMSPSWPFQLDDGTVPTELSFGEKIYNLTFLTTTNVLQIEVLGPFPESVYPLLFPGDAEGAAAAFARDTEIFNAYREDVKKILNSKNSDGLAENFFGFNWGNIDNFSGANDASAVISEVEEVISITEACNDCPTTPTGFTRSRLSVSLRIQNNQNFPESLFPSGTNFWSSDSTWGNIEFNPSLLDSTLAGDIVQLNGNFGITENQYIEIGDLGRYFVTDVVEDIYFFVNRVDGFDFELGSHTAQEIRNINLQPRLKIKYRLPGGQEGGGGEPPTAPAGTYEFYSVIEDGEYRPLAGNGSRFATESLVSSEHQFLIEDAEGLFTVGGGISINDINILNKGLPWAVKTTKEDQTEEGGFVSARVTPWRKGYRAVNRFVPKECTLRRFKESTGTNAFVKQNMTVGIASSSRTGTDITYPEAILHAPTLAQLASGSVGNGGKGDIVFTTDRIGDVQLLSGSFGTGSDGFMRHGYDHTIETEDDAGNPLSGYILEETAPNRITFIANMKHQSNARGIIPKFNYTGHVSTKYGVIPAYSGEIVAADNRADTQENPDHGFIEFDYSNPDIGLVNQFAVFLDISETDEVLRWNTSNYDAAAFWRNTFSALQVFNVTKGTSVNLQNYTVKKNSKSNFVVVMHKDMNASDLIDFVTAGIEDDDEIRIEFRSKQVIENYTEGQNPSDPNTSYVPIAYRPLTDEGQDDIFVEAVASSLSDFNISSDGSVDGNITVNYDGDVPDGTEFRLFVEEDEDTTP